MGETKAKAAENVMKKDVEPHYVGKEPAEMEFLRLAINAPSTDEVRNMIKQELIEYNFLNKIELKQGDIVTTLKDEPRHFMFPDILAVVNAGMPVALIGPAGSGKSTVVEQIAVAVKLPFYLQNSVSGVHELAGYMDAHGKYHGTSFRTAFEKGGVLMVDEADTSDASAFKWVNTGVANGYAMFPDSDVPINRHKDFRIVIAANTYGNGADRLYVGANQLDASTLDRFVFFNFHYDEKLEVLLAGDVKWAGRVQRLRKAAFAEKARIVISPRASIHGARLLKLGWKQSAVEQSVIWKGTDADLKDRIERKAA